MGGKFFSGLLLATSLIACVDSPTAFEADEVKASDKNAPQPGGFGGAPKPAENKCDVHLTGIVRDFLPFTAPGGHPDFEHYVGSRGQKRMVMDDLGADLKPQYNPNPDPITKEDYVSNPDAYAKSRYITTPDSFQSWYRDTSGVNQSFLYELTVKQDKNGISTFANEHFFPIDGKGFGVGGKDEKGVDHNFGFTFELRTKFTYSGGEYFTFEGDDDLWVFINKKLAIDLGGVHVSLEETVKLDDVAEKLGIEKGGSYSLDMFHAERKADGSHFKLATSVVFTNCEPILIR